MSLSLFIPVRLSNDWTLITRTVIPVIQVPDLAPGVDGTSGVGDAPAVAIFITGESRTGDLGRRACGFVPYGLTGDPRDEKGKRSGQLLLCLGVWVIGYSEPLCRTCSLLPDQQRGPT